MSRHLINKEELNIKLETMITFGRVKLSDLFIVVGSPEEGFDELELDDKFITTLRENLAGKNLDLVQLIDTKKIKTFFSKDCIKFADGTPVYAKYVLDHRKFAYPNISVPKSIKVN